VSWFLRTAAGHAASGATHVEAAFWLHRAAPALCQLHLAALPDGDARAGTKMPAGVVARELLRAKFNPSGLAGTRLGP